MSDYTTTEILKTNLKLTNPLKSALNISESSTIVAVKPLDDGPDISFVGRCNVEGSRVFRVASVVPVLGRDRLLREEEDDEEHVQYNHCDNWEPETDPFLAYL